MFYDLCNVHCPEPLLFVNIRSSCCHYCCHFLWVVNMAWVVTFDTIDPAMHPKKTRYAPVHRAYLHDYITHSPSGAKYYALSHDLHVLHDLGRYGDGINYEAMSHKNIRPSSTRFFMTDNCFMVYLPAAPCVPSLNVWNSSSILLISLSTNVSTLLS